MGEVFSFLFVAFVAGWFVRSELKERNNRKFDEAWTRYQNLHPQPEDEQ